MSNKHKKQHQEYALEQLEECFAILSAFSVIHGIPYSKEQRFPSIRTHYLLGMRSNSPKNWVIAVDTHLNRSLSRGMGDSHTDYVVNILYWALKNLEEIYKKS